MVIDNCYQCPESGDDYSRQLICSRGDENRPIPNPEWCPLPDEEK